MKSKDELKEIDIKNYTCYYSDDRIRFWDRDIDFSDVLLDENLYKEKYENILVYDISYKTLTGAKPLCIRTMKQMNLLKFKTELNIYHYLIMGGLIKLVISYK